MLRARAAVVVSAICALLLLFSSTAQAAPGDLDGTFGLGGKVVTGIGGEADALVVLPNGKLVVGGGFGLARLNANGTMDRTFGLRGKASTAFGVRDLVVQPDGKLVAAGPHAGSLEGDLDFALARYTPTGALDMTFGDGGIVVTDFFGGPDDPNAIVLQPDGKLVVAGQALKPDVGWFSALARYNPDGSPDTGFGSEGKVAAIVNRLAQALALQPDGKLVVAGYKDSGLLESDFFVQRLAPDGSLDSVFGSGGEVITDFGGGLQIATSVVVQPDGNLVVAGIATFSGSPYFALARFGSTGNPDSTFGSGGKVITNVANGEATDLVLQPDGKLVAGGGGGFPADFALARYNSDGSLDPTFGTGGKVTTDFAGLYDEAFALALQPDGNIVAAGAAENRKGLRVALARYMSA